MIEKFETEAHIYRRIETFLFELLFEIIAYTECKTCLLYTSDAADE